MVDLHIGEEKGITPRLATVKARAIVASGAFPIIFKRGETSRKFQLD